MLLWILNAKSWSILDRFRCTMADSKTSYIMTNDTQTVFKTEVFYFLQSPGAVYVQCSIRICYTSDNSTECSLCPLKRKRRTTTDESMERRALESQTVSVKSPIFYIIQSSRRILFHFFIFYLYYYCMSYVCSM